MAATKKTFAMVGGAAAVAFAVGFGGGLGIDSMAHSTPAPATPPAAVTQPAPAVHAATLTSCIAGLGC